MVRPLKEKIVNFSPDILYFKPRAVPLRLLEEVELAVEELEALRLSDLDKLSQIDAAASMKVHQSTFQRTLAKAREKITDALVNGKAIKIEGGNYKMLERDGTCPNEGFGRGRMNGPNAAGPGGVCKCPSCGNEQKHERGIPCSTVKCSKCGTLMVRA